MNGQEAAVLIVGTVGVSSLAVTWMKMHYRSPKGVAGGDLAAIQARLERIEQAVDAIAVETERISEGQRFTTKLLSERTTSGSERP
jgi:hypothetical protein